MPGISGGVNRTDDLRGKSSLVISGGVNRTDNLRGKSSLAISGGG